MHAHMCIMGGMIMTIHTYNLTYSSSTTQLHLAALRPARARLHVGRNQAPPHAQQPAPAVGRRPRLLQCLAGAAIQQRPLRDRAVRSACWPLRPLAATSALCHRSAAVVAVSRCAGWLSRAWFESRPMRAVLHLPVEQREYQRTHPPAARALLRGGGSQRRMGYCHAAVGVSPRPHGCAPPLFVPTS